MLVWCLHNCKPLYVMARPRDGGLWYIPSLKVTKDGSELFRRPQGLIRFVMRLKEKPKQHTHRTATHLRLIQGGKVA